jgi:hypothetical protein
MHTELNHDCAKGGDNFMLFAARYEEPVVYLMCYYNTHYN